MAPVGKALPSVGFRRAEGMALEAPTQPEGASGGYQTTGGSCDSWSCEQDQSGVRSLVQSGQTGIGGDETAQTGRSEQRRSERRRRLAC